MEGKEEADAEEYNSRLSMKVGKNKW